LVGFLEVNHELSQNLRLLHSHGVEERGSDATDRSVTLQLNHALSLGLGHEPRLEVGVPGLTAHSERDVYATPRVRLNGRVVEAVGLIDGVVYQFASLVTASGHSLQTSVVFNPLQIQSTHIYRINGWCVVQRVIVVHNLVVENRWTDIHSLSDEILADHDESQTGDSAVLLCARNHCPVLLDIDGSGEEVGGHIAH